MNAANHIAKQQANPAGAFDGYTAGGVIGGYNRAPPPPSASWWNASVLKGWKPWNPTTASTSGPARS